MYPLYFDAKVSINNGRRIPRQAAVWWPQATYISQACRSLGLLTVLEVCTSCTKVSVTCADPFRSLAR